MKRRDALSRREMLRLGAGATFALAFGTPAAGAAANAWPRAPAGVPPAQGELIRKAIPKSGERIPVIGLGSAGTFNVDPGHPEYGNAKEVVRLFHELGGTVVDTAPSYQRSERFLGETTQELGIADKLFIATKVNVGSAGKDAALRQMENSLRVFGRDQLDLIQVWNLGGSIARLSAATLDEHMQALSEFKTSGRIRYLGITTSRDPQYADTEAAMQKYDLDFVQLDYSIGDRVPEQRLLPLARERRIAVLANRPFATGQLFRRVRGRELPDWAAEIDCRTWAQYFLKFVVSHPAVTCAIPATNDPEHLRDNMGACFGRLPDEATRARMIEYFESI